MPVRSCSRKCRSSRPVSRAASPADRGAADRPCRRGAVVRLHVHMFRKHERGHILEHRNLDRLAFSAPLAMKERHQDHLDRDQAHGLVRHDHRQVARLAGCAVVERRDPRGTLDDRIVGGLTAITPVLAEAEHATVDHLRIDRLHVVVRKLHARHRVRPHVPDEHVRLRGELHQRVVAGCLLQVEHDRALVPVQMQELRAHAGRNAEAADRASEIPARAFDLDHIGAVVGENLCGERTDDDRSQIEDTYAVQGTTRHSKSMFTSMEGSTIRSEDKGFQ